MERHRLHSSLHCPVSVPYMLPPAAESCRIIETNVCDGAMKVKILLFASFREAAGLSQGTLDVEPEATLGDVWARLAVQYPRLAPHAGTAAFAINGTYAKPGERVHDGDEVAFLPPVSGG